MREQVVETLYKEIEPALSAMEPLRQKALRKNTNLQIGLAVGLVILFVVVFIVLPMPFPANAVIVFALFGIGLGYRNFFKNQYVNRYKKDLTQILLSQFGIQSTHESSQHIYAKYFKQSALFSYANAFSGDDLIKGQKDGLYFLGSELEAKHQKERENLPDIDRLIFNGFYFCGQIKKDTGTTVTIHSIDFEYQNPKRDNFIADYKFESLNTEFDDNFRLEYSDYDLTSHILTPEFMQKLLDFKAAHQLPFVIRIARNQVYIAIQEKKEFFDISFNEQANSRKHIKVLADDCQFFFDLVQLLERL